MAGTTAGAGRGRAPIVGINVTPMVDVVLVLLVIMMVSATYIVSQSLKVELPKTATSDEQPPEVVTVTIDKTGKLLLDEKDTTRDALEARLRSSYAKNENVSVVVSADKDATHGNVVDVIDLAKTVGITKFAIHVESPVGDRQARRSK